MFRNKGCGCNRQNMFMGEPIMEPVITTCVEKEFYHEVPHICPIHTHTINKHIYNHSYTPQYTCSEEDQIINNECNRCNNFINR